MSNTTTVRNEESKEINAKLDSLRIKPQQKMEFDTKGFVNELRNNMKQQETANSQMNSSRSVLNPLAQFRNSQNPFQ